VTCASSLNSFFALRFIATVEHRFGEGIRAINDAILSELTGYFGPSLILVREEDLVLVFASKIAAAAKPLNGFTAA